MASDHPASGHKLLKLAVLDASDDPKWAGLTKQYFSDALSRPGDTLTMFSLPACEMPALEDVKQGKYDAILISGSRHSVHEDERWIKQLTELLPAYAATGKTQLVGTCFGHQLLAQALGGQVGNNPSGRFVLKVEDVAFDASALERCGLRQALEQGIANSQQQQQQQQQPRQLQQVSASSAGEAERGALASALHSAAAPGAQAAGGSDPLVETEPSRESAAAAPAPGLGVDLPASGEDGAGGAAGPVLSVPLIQSHGEQVLRLPPGALPLASSATATHEMWTMPHVIAFQFHPEFPGTDVVLEKIHPALTGNGRLSPEEAAASEASLRHTAPNPGPVRALIRAFMEGAVASPDTSSSAAVDAAPALPAGNTPDTAVASTATATAEGLPVPAGSQQPPRSPALAAGTGPGPEGQAGGSVSANAEPAADAASRQPAVPLAPDRSTGPGPVGEAGPGQGGEGGAVGGGEMGEELQRLVTHMRGAFNAGLQQGALQWDQLAAINAAAAAKCGDMAATAGALADFAQKLSDKQAVAQATLASIPELESQLRSLSEAVDALDVQSRQLAKNVGLGDSSGLGGTFSWR